MRKGYSGFHDFLQEEVKKTKGIYMPVRASLVRRALVRRASCRRLHPNPDDEFCFPEIGPNEEIIGQYRERLFQMEGQPLQAFGTPITVEKIKPDGYLILNGHHRWAAAMQLRVRSVPIEIVNLTQEADLRDMFDKASRDKRITFDLDEVVFCQDPQADRMEKPLPFPLNTIYKQRLCLGIPALFRFFRNQGYDIWVYSSKYYSMDYIRNLFRHYHVQVTGIVTGTARKASADAQKRERMEKEFRELYAVTVHADHQTLVYVDNRTKAFAEYELNGEEQWSAAIMEIMREIPNHEE